MMTITKFNSDFNGLSGVLRSFAFNLTKDMEEAKDLYQETAYRAFKNYTSFTVGSNLKAWLMTIMKNIFINNYRKKVKSNTIFDHSEDQYFLNTGGPVVQNESGSSMLMDELLAMIQDLDDALKVPFLMHYEGFRYQEIAETIGLPIGTVKSRIFHARQRLQSKALQKYQSKELLLSSDVH